jgi:putative ABC transport system ATP-binding protein
MAPMYRETVGSPAGSSAGAAAVPVVQMSAVGRAFRTGEVEVHALEDVSLDFGRSELAVVLGPSGSGKTTLLNLLGGLDRPTSGVIRYGAVDITALSDGELGRFRRDHVGFVFQFFNLIPTLTARENVEFAAELVSSDRQVIDARVGELLSMVGLQERADHFPSQLSGGEQQRVAIARALAKDPDLVLCDEPTGNLDFRTGRQILEFLQGLALERGKTCLLVTHNSAIAAIGSRVIRLRDGRVQSDEANHSPSPASQVEW